MSEQLKTELHLDSPLSKLKSALDKIILAKAHQMEQIAMGETPDIPINPKDWDSALKIIEKMPSLELYDKGVFDMPFEVKTKPQDTENEDVEENPFEAQSRKVKDKLNGNTSSKAGTT